MQTDPDQPYLKQKTIRCTISMAPQNVLVWPVEPSIYINPGIDVYWIAQQSRLTGIITLQRSYRQRNPRRHRILIWYWFLIWASSRENLSSGFPSKRVSNRSPQLHRLARKLKFYGIRGQIWYFPKANNIGADQTARMRRLVCAYVIRKPQKTGFLALRPI